MSCITLVVDWMLPIAGDSGFSIYRKETELLKEETIDNKQKNSLRKKSNIISGKVL